MRALVSILCGAALGLVTVEARAQGAQPTARADAEALPAGVRQFFADYFAAVEAGDVARLLALLDSEFVIKGPSGAPLTDRDQLRAAWGGLFDRVRQEVDWEILEGQAAGAWAWVRVRERATHRPLAGGEARVLEGSHLAILRKVGGRWRLHRDYGSLDRAPYPAP